MSSSQSLNFLYSSQKCLSINQLFFKKDKYQQKKSFDHHKKIVIEISQQDLKSYQQNISWRMNTDFPIIKVLKFNKLSSLPKSNSYGQYGKISIELMIQPISVTIDEISQIPIFKVLYLLRQTLIATQRLCSMYGKFIVKPNMVCINLLNKCKIWHNSQFHINQPQILSQSEHNTVQSIVSLFKVITKKSIISKKIYQELQKCISFCQCFQSLKKICKQSKIRISSSFDVKSVLTKNMFPSKENQHLQNLNLSKSSRKKCFLSPQLTKRNTDFATPQVIRISNLNIWKKTPSFIHKKILSKSEENSNENTKILEKSFDEHNQ